MKVNVPPIKSQGIKTKLVPWINSVIPGEFRGLWIEPFMGTGAVAFNLAPGRALLCDTNPHLINFYKSVAKGDITPETVRDFLTREGEELSEKGEDRYYEIRDRFNSSHQPLDFLFLNRAGFNGMIRFNRKGKFNTPFCRKPQRFSQAYVTKIANQVSCVAHLLKIKDFVFKCQTFEETIAESGEDDIVYCDPPYIGRHVDYYSGWDWKQERGLYQALSKTPGKFILSTWHHNDFRKNEYIDLLWGKFNIFTREHFYHIGGSEKNRNPVVEAIITNYDAPVREYRELKERVQLTLLENQAPRGM